MKFWTSARVGRGDFVFGLLIIGVVFTASAFALTGRILNLTLVFGFRTNWQLFGIEPLTVTALRLGCDALTVWFVVRRVRDTDHPGWWGLGIILLPLLLGSVGAAVSLLALIVLIFVSGTIGPNRFGPDPRGWKSREQYEAQEQRLKSGEV